MQSLLQARRLVNGAKRDFDSFYTQADSAVTSHHSASDINFAEDGKEINVKDHRIPGVQVSESSENGSSLTYQVGWAEGDPENPMNWSRTRKWCVTTTVSLITIAVSIPSSIDGPVSTQFNEHYHVGPIAGSLTTGMTDIKLPLAVKN
jgi:hypothetical protein